MNPAAVFVTALFVMVLIFGPSEARVSVAIVTAAFLLLAIVREARRRRIRRKKRQLSDARYYREYRETWKGDQ